MQLLGLIFALFCVSTRAATMKSQGCPQDLCFQGICQPGGVGCAGNAKCMDVGLPGQLGCCGPCRTVPTSVTSFVTSTIVPTSTTSPLPTGIPPICGDPFVICP